MKKYFDSYNPIELATIVDKQSNELFKITRTHEHVSDIDSY